MRTSKRGNSRAGAPFEQPGTANIAQAGLSAAASSSPEMTAVLDWKQTIGSLLETKQTNQAAWKPINLISGKEWKAQIHEFFVQQPALLEKVFGINVEELAQEAQESDLKLDWKVACEPVGPEESNLRILHLKCFKRFFRNEVACFACQLRTVIFGTCALVAVSDVTTRDGKRQLVAVPPEDAFHHIMRASGDWKSAVYNHAHDMGVRLHELAIYSILVDMVPIAGAPSPAKLRQELKKFENAPEPQHISKIVRPPPSCRQEMQRTGFYFLAFFSQKAASLAMEALSGAIIAGNPVETRLWIEKDHKYGMESSASPETNLLGQAVTIPPTSPQSKSHSPSFSESSHSSGASIQTSRATPPAVFRRSGTFGSPDLPKARLHEESFVKPLVPSAPSQQVQPHVNSANGNCGQNSRQLANEISLLQNQLQNKTQQLQALLAPQLLSHQEHGAASQEEQEATDLIEQAMQTGTQLCSTSAACDFDSSAPQHECPARSLAFKQTPSFRGDRHGCGQWGCFQSHQNFGPEKYDNPLENTLGSSFHQCTTFNSAKTFRSPQEQQSHSTWTSTPNCSNFQDNNHPSAELSQRKNMQNQIFQPASNPLWSGTHQQERQNEQQQNWNFGFGNEEWDCSHRQHFESSDTTSRLLDPWTVSSFHNHHSKPKVCVIPQGWMKNSLSLK